MVEEKSHEANELSVSASLERDKAISYLEDILAGLRAGRVSVEHGAESVSLTIPSALKVSVKAKQKTGKESLSLKLSWHAATEPGTRDEVRISPGDAGGG